MKKSLASMKIGLDQFLRGRGRIFRQRGFALLALAIVMVSSTAAQAATRIAFISDQDGSSGLDVWKINDTGTGREQVTDESGEARHPTIAPGGLLVVYEVEGSLFMNDFADPIGEPVFLSSGEDPYAGPAINPDGDFRIIFYIGVSGSYEIWMGTVDVSEGDLIDVVELTDDPYHHDIQPSFCGDEHFVWIRDDSYGGELCRQEFDEYGPVEETMTCYFGGIGDYLHDEHPSCDSEGNFITWARENSSYSGTHDIWIMDYDGTDAHAMITNSVDDTMPDWNPGNTEIAFARWDPTDSDYEIFILEVADPENTVDQVTSNSDEDHSPSYGPGT